MSSFPHPTQCDCGEARTRKEDVYVLASIEGKQKPVYSSSRFVCVKCGKPRFEARIVRKT
jgi:hypothetical protein